MNPADVWRSLGEKLRFFTKETAADIPPVPGTYAWFLPLWLYCSDLNDFIGLVNRTYLYDARAEGPPITEGELETNWERLHVTAKVRYHRSPSPAMDEQWRRALNSPVARDALQLSMMEASMLLPPLYVGKANNLRSRYEQHVAGSEKNSFHTRFTSHATSNDLPLRVSDLLFACILTNPAQDAVLEEFGLNSLLEQLMMRLARPPFSLR